MKFQRNVVACVFSLGIILAGWADPAGAKDRSTAIIHVLSQDQILSTVWNHFLAALGSGNEKAIRSECTSTGYHSLVSRLDPRKPRADQWRQWGQEWSRLGAMRWQAITSMVAYGRLGLHEREDAFNFVLTAKGWKLDQWSPGESADTSAEHPPVVAAQASPEALKIQEARKDWDARFNKVKSMGPEALEKEGETLDQLEKNEALGASAASQLYLLYLRIRLEDRARRFRQAVLQKNADWESFFEKVDQQCKSWALECDNSRVLGIRVAAQTAARLTLDVDYDYSGQGGAENTRVECAALSRESSRVFSGFEPGLVSAGRHTVSIAVFLTETAPDHFETDELRCSLYHVASTPWTDLTIPYKKSWFATP